MRLLLKCVAQMKTAFTFEPFDCAQVERTTACRQERLSVMQSASSIDRGTRGILMEPGDYAVCAERGSALAVV